MMVFKSKNMMDDDVIYDEQHFLDLSEKLAKESIANFRNDLDKIFSDEE